MSDIKGISVNGTQYTIEDETARTALNSKYVKPSGGIPASDLASAVQTSLGKADNAIPAPSSPASGDVLKYNGSAWIADESDGLSSGIKQALLNCFAHVAWTDEHGQDYYDALEDALYPPVPLVSISAVYTQSGTVYDTDTLDSLKDDLVVTATYEDSTTAVVTDYTLSGTLTAGTSTITVSYGGKTTTFSVTVTQGKSDMDGWADGIAYTDLEIVQNSYVSNTDGSFIAYNGWNRTGYVPCNGASTITIPPMGGTGTSPDYNAFYTSDHQFISTFETKHSENSVVTVPSNAYYFIISESVAHMNTMINAGIVPNA